MLKAATEALRSWVRQSFVTLHVRTCQALYLFRWNIKKTGPRGCRPPFFFFFHGTDIFWLLWVWGFFMWIFSACKEGKKWNWVRACVYVTSADVCWSKWFHLEQMNNLSWSCKGKKAGRWGEGGGELMENKVVQHRRTVENKFVLVAGEENLWFSQWSDYEFVQRNILFLHHFDWALILCCSLSLSVTYIFIWNSWTVILLKY